MTEENKMEPVSPVQEVKTDAALTEDVQVKKDEVPNVSVYERKTSNLKGRCKRNKVTGAATIKEDDSKLPKEIKSIKIDSAERMDNCKKACNKKSENCMKCDAFKEREKSGCCCCSFLCKVKNFFLKLFGFGPKKDKPYRKNYRNRRYSGQKRRNYRSNSRNQSR